MTMFFVKNAEIKRQNETFLPLFFIAFYCNKDRLRTL